MKKLSTVSFLSILAFLLIAGNSFALSLNDLGTQITVNDGQANSQWGGGSNALGIASEDNETETGTLTYQSWDLEGMFWNANTKMMYIIGGFNYTAAGIGSYTEVAGDIFIGNNSQYVLDLNRKTTSDKYLKGGYLYSNSNYTVKTGNFTKINPEDVPDSTPFAYQTGGTTVAGANSYYTASKISATDWANIDLFQAWRQSGQNDPLANWTNDVHYVLAIHASDMVAELINAGNLIHMTESCGNDTIEGKVKTAAPVPEPATMLLFGSGLVGLAGFGRKRFLKRG